MKPSIRSNNKENKNTKLPENKENIIGVRVIAFFLFVNYVWLQSYLRDIFITIYLAYTVLLDKIGSPDFFT